MWQEEGKLKSMVFGDLFFISNHKIEKKAEYRRFRFTAALFMGGGVIPEKMAVLIFLPIAFSAVTYLTDIY